MTDFIRALFGGRGETAVSVAKAPTPDRIKPTDQRLRCYCGETHPLELMRPLYDVAYRKQESDAPLMVEEVTGGIAHCHACGETFAFGQMGKFKRMGGARPPAGAPPVDGTTHYPPPRDIPAIATPLERPNL